MVFFTADLHFGSVEIAEKRNAAFSSVEDMDAQLVHNWNRCVSPEDTVYLVGDICCHDAPFPDRYLSLLNGHKHLIRGNHDTGMEQQERLFDYFESVSDFLEIEENGIHIVLCHYPIVYVQRGYMIHGHIHEPKGTVFEILKQMERVLNACVDRNQFRPVCLKELIQNNESFYGILKSDYRKDLKLHNHSQKWKADFKPLPIKPDHKET